MTIYFPSPVGTVVALVVLGFVLAKARRLPRVARVCIFVAAIPILWKVDVFVFSELLTRQRRTDFINRCQTNLRQISLAIQAYCSHNEGRYPPSLEHLYPTYVDKASRLHCPRVTACIGISKNYPGWTKPPEYVPMAELGNYTRRPEEEVARLPVDYTYHPPPENAPDGYVVVEETAYTHPRGFFKEPTLRQLLLLNGEIVLETKPD